MTRTSGRARARAIAVTVAAGAVSAGALMLLPQPARADGNDGPVGSGGVKYYRHLLREARSEIRMATSAPAEVILPGGTYTWPFTVTNHGPSAARSIMVSISPQFRKTVASEDCTWVRVQAANAPAKASGPNSGVVSNGATSPAKGTTPSVTFGKAGGLSTCRMSALAKGESESGVVTATVPKQARAGELLTPSATYTWTAPAGSQHSSTSFPGVEVTPATRMGVRRNAPATAPAGSVVPERIMVVNRGAMPARNVVVNTTVTSPKRIILGTTTAGCAAGAPQSAPAAPTAPGATVPGAPSSPSGSKLGRAASLRCDIPALRVGGTHSFTVSVRTAPGADAAEVRCATNLSTGTPLLGATMTTGNCATRMLPYRAATETGPQLPMTGSDTAMMVAMALIFMVGGGVFYAEASRPR